jgi:hypothetical protein
MLLTVNVTTAQVVVKETTSTTTSAGTISEFGPETIIIRTETSPEPVRYSFSKTTTYVDETGAPVSIETVKSGLPVTVYYVKVGDKMVASKVIVRKAVVKVVPAIEEKKTTTTTTTTTEK